MPPFPLCLHGEIGKHENFKSFCIHMHDGSSPFVSNSHLITMPSKSHVTVTKYLNSDQLQYLHRIEQDPNFWKHAQLMYIRSKQNAVTNDFKKLIAIKTPLSFNFESELEQAFNLYDRVNHMTIENQASFWYWFAGLIDGDGHLRSTKKSTEIVVTMGEEDIALLYWLKHVLGGRIVPVKDKKAFRIIYLQSNCEFKALIEHLNGKLRHPNKIKGLTQICTKFNLKLNNVENLSKLAQDYSDHFKAYVRGLFDADGSIYVRGARHTVRLQSNSATEYWLSQRMTAKSLRIEISIAGEQHLMTLLSKCLGANCSTSRNKPKADGSPSISYKIAVSQSSVNQTSNFTNLCTTLTQGCAFLPFSIKHIRLNMQKSFDCLTRPFFFSNHDKVVHEQCIDWLLTWLLWPIANKEQLYALSTKTKF
jgi:hypothetical protein